MDELKVISFNVHSCVGSDEHYSVSRVAQALVNHNPCIVCLQEVEANTALQQTRIWSARHSSDQPQEIATQLELPHVRFAPAIKSVAQSRRSEQHDTHDALGEFGIAILSKYAIITTKHCLYKRYGNKTLRNALACLVELPCEAKVWIINTHLGCHWGGEQYEQAKELAQFIESLDSAIDNLVGVILCGDLNSLPHFRSVETIKAAGMVDAFEQGGIGSGRTFPAVGTFPMCCCVPVMRLDYVFIKGRLDCLVLKYAIVMRGGEQDDREHAIASDHLPLCAVFEVKLPT